MSYNFLLYFALKWFENVLIIQDAAKTFLLNSVKQRSLSWAQSLCLSAIEGSEFIKDHEFLLSTKEKRLDHSLVLFQVKKSRVAVGFIILALQILWKNLFILDEVLDKIISKLQFNSVHLILSET